MYLPRDFRVEDEGRLFELIDAIGVATVTSAGPAGLIANEVPLLLEPDTRRLWGHLAKPNSQLQEFAGVDQVLVNFLGPSCYISPNWYTDSGLVPTWNFVSVQLRGKVVLHEGRDEVQDIVRRLSAKHEAPFASPWTMDKMDPVMLDKMLAVIVGFHIEIEEIVGKLKLSQNRKPEDRAGVIAGLQASGQREMADWMQSLETTTDTTTNQ